MGAANSTLLEGSESNATSPRSAVLGPSGAVLAVALSLALVFGVFWPTTRSMVEIWERSETFQHCYVVLPIVLWLVWNCRARLASTPVKVFWPGLLAIALLGFGWMLASLGAVLVVEQLAVVGLAAAVVLTAFGRGVVPGALVPAAVPVLRGPFRGSDRAATDGVDRGLHRLARCA